MTPKQTQRLEEMWQEKLKEMRARVGPSLNDDLIEAVYKGSALAWQKDLAESELLVFDANKSQGDMPRLYERIDRVDLWIMAQKKYHEQTSATVAALKSENEDLKRLLNQYDEHVLSADATNKIVSDRAKLAEQTALLRVHEEFMEWLIAGFAGMFGHENVSPQAHAYEEIQMKMDKIQAQIKDLEGAKQQAKGSE